MLTDQGEGKRQKMTSSESDAAGGASAPASLGSRQPVTPPKAPAVEPSGSVASEAAGPALSEAAGPAPSQAVGPVEPQPAVEKEYALADLRSVVTTLGALDACLQHFSSKASTPESTLEPGAPHDAVQGEQQPAGAQPMQQEEVPDWGGDEAEEEQAASWDELGQSVGQMTKSSPEEIKRLSELLESHKNQIVRILEQQEAREKEQHAAGSVFEACMRQEWETAASLVERLRPEQLEQMQDYGGLTVLHHAVRSGSVEFVLAILLKCPQLASTTWAARVRSWTTQRRPTTPNLASMYVTFFSEQRENINQCQNK